MVGMAPRDSSDEESHDRQGSLIALASSTTMNAAWAQRSSQVQFKPGNYGTMVSGTTGNGSVFFNILPPGRTGAAIHVGHMGNDKDAGKTVGFNPDLSLQ